MATLAESVIGGAQQAAQGTGKTVGDAMQAYHITATAENARQQLQIQKDENERNKGTWLATQLSNISKFDGSPKTQKIMVDSLKEQLPKLAPGVDPRAIDTVMGDAQGRLAAGYLAAHALDTGKITPDSFGAMVTTFQSQENAIDHIEKMKTNQAHILAAQMGTAAVKRDQLEETKRQNALHFGEQAEGNKILQLGKQNFNSLIRSENILKDPGLPVTANDFNLAYQDYSNAVAQGGAATEGQIQRDLPEATVLEMNNLIKKYAGTNVDLRQTAAGKRLIDQLGGRITGVKGDINNAIAKQGRIFHDIGVNSGNPYVAQQSKDILQRYAPSDFNQLYGSKTAAPSAPAPQAAAPETPAEAVYKVKDPYGNVRAIPQSKLQDALAHGGKQVMPETAGDN